MKTILVRFKKDHQLDGAEIKAGAALGLRERTANRLGALGIVEIPQAAPVRPEPITPRKRAADGQP